MGDSSEFAKYDLRDTRYEIRDTKNYFVQKNNYERFICMSNVDFRNRTKLLGLRIIKLVEQLPNSIAAAAIGRQIVRSGLSIGANYRAARRAKSTRDHINKLKIVEEEADETMFWLEILAESKIVAPNRLQDLIRETDEIIAIIVASIKTLRKSKEIRSR